MSPPYTDAELEALFAERVLGHPDPASLPYRPLTYISDAMAGLEAHPEWYSIAIERSKSEWFCYVQTISAVTLGETNYQHAMLCRAIVYATLIAVGVDRERLP